MPDKAGPAKAGDGKVKDIAFKDLEAGVRKKELVVIDVRSPEEFASGRISGSINIPLGEVAGAFKNLNEEQFKAKYGFDKNSKNLVFSCRSGGRAAAAVENLNGVIPIESCRLYRGSFMDWEANKGPIDK